ncbi:MAG: hypothetical protein IPP83_15360 [Flavobacteriales bacterium]|nr:hypothetical protein [Flavobacteriales bacterium]
MAKRKHHIPLDIEIDKLTNSIEEAATGKSVATLIGRVLPEDKLIRAKDWRFDWTKEMEQPHHEVYALTADPHPGVIQGLISIEDNGDHVHMHLLESARFNQGKGKLFLGVPPNLAAHACRISLQRGHGGIVAFVAKTKLRQHYIDTLGASVIRGDRLYISAQRAEELVTRYFKLP